MQIIESYYSKDFRDINPEELVTKIRTDEVMKAQTELHRGLLVKGGYQKDSVECIQAKKEKKKLPQVAISFRMVGGKEKIHCRECLNHVMIDFDAKNPGEQLPSEELERVITIMRTSYHTEIGCRSISDLGYHIVVPFILPEGITIDLATDFKRGEAIFKRVHQYINNVYGVWCGHQMDPECSNINRMMGLGYDPEAVYRPDVRPFRLSRQDLGIDDEGNLKEMKTPRWAAGKDGKHLAVALGDSLQRAEKMVREDGVDFASGSHHNFVMRVGFILNRLGIDEDQAAQAADNAYAAEMSDSPSAIIHSCYRTAACEFGAWMEKRSSNAVKAEMIANFLKDKQLQYDILTRKKRMLKENGMWEEMFDRDQNDLFIECCSVTGENFTEKLFETVLNSSVIPAVNPLRLYLSSLEEWSDGMPDYIRQAADMVHMTSDKETELWHSCFRKWFVAMVKGWIDENVVNHQVICLIGKQGIFKSTWIRNLLPPELQAYVSDMPEQDRFDKDERLRAAEYAIINLDELDKLSDRELNKLKALVTSTHIDERASFGHNKEKRVRIASYAASGNKEEFLTDQTGNRRWLPFHVIYIDSPFTNKLPYSGMYAQALYLLKNNFNYWFDNSEVDALKEHVDKFMVPDSIEELLLTCYAPAEKNMDGAKFLKLSEIAAKIADYGRLRKPVDTRHLSAMMKKHHFVKGRDNSHNRDRGYIVREYTPAEIQQLHDPNSGVYRHGED